MAIPDPNKLYPKLEKDGVEEVRKKLAMGVYADYKIPLIREWLNTKENEQLDLEENVNINGIKYKSLKCYYLWIEFWRDQWKPLVTGIIILLLTAIIL